MAADPDLRASFHDADPDAEEMERHRAALARGLVATSPRRPWRRLAAFPLAAAAAGALVVLAPSTGPELDQSRPEEVRELVVGSRDPGALAVAARRALRSEDPTVRGNARLVVVLTGTPESAVAAAAAAVLDEPRAEFRAVHLEWLLDRADEATVDPEVVERLLDDEHDPLCRSLLGEMLRLAELTGRRGGGASRVS